MIAPLLLLFHTLPDPSGTPLLAQVRLAALRALAAQRDGAEDLEARLALFFRQQCGATKLRHLSELRLDAGSRGVFAAENSNLGTSFAVICSALAVSSVGLGAESEGLALTSSVPPSLFEASKPLLKLRVDWAATYAKAFPHRKLAWRPLLSSGVVLWRHQQGNTEICCSELQVHLLLALARRHSLSVAEVREAALAWEEGCPEGDRVTIQDHWERALAALCDGSNSPLLRHEAADIGGAGWRAEPGSRLGGFNLVGPCPAAGAAWGLGGFGRRCGELTEGPRRRCPGSSGGRCDCAAAEALACARGRGAGCKIGDLPGEPRASAGQSRRRLRLCRRAHGGKPQRGGARAGYCFMRKRAFAYAR
eukprot:gnl/TRDRNA2_/TRDRNA2_141617_c2_seq2.p1 gnl/TRDRNA2_/TRDRNA2_141617_c2~~gnl/TRDRNA2_/TRDRNA2_141617_c2_seq2.p1  ORF type:complete len:390 (-),score=53.92 gnl/TRDRNA2_/TRDRNA2_141617_c2_seq2:91-1182(-)